MLELTLSIFMELFLYNLGRATIAIVSLGHVRTESLKEAFAFRKRSDAGDTGNVVPASIGQLVGGLVFTLFLMVLVAVNR